MSDKNDESGAQKQYTHQQKELYDHNLLSLIFKLTRFVKAAESPCY